MNADPIVTPYDSSTTLLYKWARRYDFPSQFIIMRRVSEQISYLDPRPLLQREVASGKNLRQIYDQFYQLSQGLNLDSIIYLYYFYATDPSTGRNLSREQALRETVDLDREIGGFTSPRFLSLEDLQNGFNTWNASLGMLREEDAERLEDIQEIHNDLVKNSTGKLNYSGLDVTGAVIVSKPGYAERPITKEDGLDIFNNSRANKYTPYIQYNDSEGKKYYKFIKDDVDYVDLGIMPSPARNSRHDTIYISLWMGDESHVSDVAEDFYEFKKLRNEPSTSFYHVVYKLDEGTLELNMPTRTRGNQVTDRNEALRRVSMGLQGVFFSKIEEVKTKGNFDIYGLILDVPSFLSFILNVPVAQKYVYTEEHLRPFAYKQRLDIHFHEIYSEAMEDYFVIEENGSKGYLSETNISLTIQVRKETTDTVHPYITPTGQRSEATIPAGVGWLHLVINGGASRESIDQAISVLRILFKIYRDNQQGEIEFYRQFFSVEEMEILNARHYSKAKQEAVPDQFRAPSVVTSRRRVMTRIEQLKAVAPDVAVDSYAGQCQSKSQPIILRPDQVQAWSNETFIHRGKTYNRQVLPFPPRNPKYYFGCPNPANPFPGAQDNSTLANKDLYPCVPCCFSSNQMDPEVSSKYNECYHGRKMPTGPVKINAKKKTDVILKPYETSFVPKSVESVLEFYREANKLPGNRDRWEIRRMGVGRNTNSLLSCVCEAIEYPAYMTTHPDDRDDFLSGIRENLLPDFAYPDLMRQELYDYDDERILDVLADNGEFLDPSLFFRALEELFFINIYVFGLDKEDRSRDEGQMIIPRHKIFSARPPRYDRPTVIIFRHWGSPSDALEYPQCELIIDFNTDSEYMVKLFGLNMTERCSSLLSSVSSNITWLQHISLPVKIDQPARPIYPHKNLYTSVDYAALLGSYFDKEGHTNVVRQYIDPMGKARSLTLSYEIQGYVFEISFITPPIAPENAPHSGEFARPDSRAVYEIMKNSTAVSRSINRANQTDGIWYKLMEIDEAIYVPILATTEVTPAYANLPIGSINPLGKNSHNNTIRYMKLLRTMGLLQEILEWLYEVARREADGDVNLDFFLNYILTSEEIQVEDTANFYDFSHIPRRLPKVQTLREAVIYIGSVLPQSRNGKILAYSTGFLHKLRKKIADYAKKTTGMSPLVRDSLQNYYRVATDFKGHPNNAILIGQGDMSRWQEDRVLEGEKIFEIRTELDLGIAMPLNPYIYSDPNNSIWMIQNPVSGTKGGAFGIAVNWKQTRINTGPQTRSLEEDKYPLHYVYVISPGGHLVAVEDNTQGGSEYVRIIKYTESRYGALLPLV